MGIPTWTRTRTAGARVGDAETFPCGARRRLGRHPVESDGLRRSRTMDQLVQQTGPVPDIQEAIKMVPYARRWDYGADCWTAAHERGTDCGLWPAA